MKLIKITASWCVSCILMNELLKKVEDAINFNYDVVDLDFDNDNEEFEKYNIGNILPVFILINNNKEIKRLIGEKSKKELVDFLLEESETNL